MGTEVIATRINKNKKEKIRLNLNSLGRPTQKSTRIVASALAEAFVKSLPKEYRTEENIENFRKMFYDLSYKLIPILLSGGSIPVKLTEPPIKTYSQRKRLERNLWKALAKFIPGDVKFSSKRDKHEYAFAVKALYHSKTDVLAIKIKVMSPEYQTLDLGSEDQPQESSKGTIPKKKETKKKTTINKKDKM